MDPRKRHLDQSVIAYERMEAGAKVAFEDEVAKGAVARWGRKTNAPYRLLNEFYLMRNYNQRFQLWDSSLDPK